MIENLLLPFGVTNLTKSEIILGFITTEQQNSFINHINLEAKYNIHLCKLEKCIPLFNRKTRITENIEKQLTIKAKKFKIIPINGIILIIINYLFTVYFFDVIFIFLVRYLFFIFFF